jgi:hypothetical protein
MLFIIVVVHRYQLHAGFENSHFTYVFFSTCIAHIVDI